MRCQSVNPDTGQALKSFEHGVQSSKKKSYAGGGCNSMSALTLPSAAKASASAMS
jgi:hypothetical protein